MSRTSDKGEERLSYGSRVIGGDTGESVQNRICCEGTGCVLFFMRSEDWRGKKEVVEKGATTSQRGFGFHVISW